MLGGTERRQTVCLSPTIYNEREGDGRQLQANTIARPGLRAPDCLGDLLFCYLNNLQVCSCFPSTASFRLQRLRLDPFVGVVERVWGCGGGAADVNTHLPAWRPN